MTANFMNRDHDADGQTTDPYADTEFSEIPPLRHTNRDNLETLLSHANDCLRYLERNGSGTDDDLRGAPVSGDRRLSEGVWGLQVAPLLASSEDVQWHGCYELTDEAPEYQSQEWREAAAALDIPDTKRYSSVPKTVKAIYKYMAKARKRGESRQFHWIELDENANIVLPDRRWEYVFEYLAEIKGVSGPAEDKPAWQHVDAAEADATDADSSKGERTHA